MNTLSREVENLVRASLEKATLELPDVLDASVSFASLGLDSVSKMGLVAEIAEQVGINFDPDEIMSCETVQEFVSVICSKREARHATTDGIESFRDALCDVLDRFDSENAQVSLESIIPLLDHFHDIARDRGEIALFKTTCMTHRSWQFFQDDPYTRRAWLKPRGFPGDAEMIDFVYQEIVPENTSEVGRQVFRATTGVSVAKSVRYRKEVVRERLHSINSSGRHALVMSIACGHMRECEGLINEIGKSCMTIIGIDQDVEALASVRTRMGEGNVKCLSASVADLLHHRIAVPHAHFIYSLGLFDYLDDSTATRLISALWRLLECGGEIMVANFTPDTEGRGYMEGVMDWTLKYRTQEALNSLIENALSDQPSHICEAFEDPFHNLAFVTVRKTF